jgi:hypothetical protein
MAIESVSGLPSRRKNRIGAAVLGPKSTLGPSSQITASPPRAVSSSLSASAISSSASSHPMRFQRPDPRGPTRRSGWVKRDGPRNRSLAQAPLLQPLGLKSGTVWLEAP